jgi:protein phosphatase
LLLTTDGLTRHVPDDGILEIIGHAPSCKEACARLIAAAKQGGGQDNITCLILQFVDKPWLRKLLDGGPGDGSPTWQDSL